MPSVHFNLRDYGPSISDVLAELRVPPLGPGELHPAAASVLREFDPLNDLGKEVVDREAAMACYSALWLFHDGLDQSHTISQDLDTAEGSFLHAIMHRREPDPSNSKYWWRKVGPHPVFELLKERTSALGYFFTSPADFVDLCEKVRGQNDAQEELAKRVQLLEWQLLFDWCYRKATG